MPRHIPQSERQRYVYILSLEWQIAEFELLYARDDVLSVLDCMCSCVNSVVQSVIVRWNLLFRCVGCRSTPPLKLVVSRDFARDRQSSLAWSAMRRYAHTGSDEDLGISLEEVRVNFVGTQCAGTDVSSISR